MEDLINGAIFGAIGGAIFVLALKFRTLRRMHPKTRWVLLFGWSFFVGILAAIYALL